LCGKRRVLLRPQLGQALRQPDPKSEQPVDTGVTGGAEDDQPCGVVNTGLAVRDMEAAGRLPCPADPAARSVAVEHALPISVKEVPEMRLRPATGTAQTGDGGTGPPAAAKQDSLANAPVRAPGGGRQS
jgi:hypothetical protein